MTIQLKDVEKAILVDNSNARVILLRFSAATGVRNVYCLTRSGEIKWQISQPDTLPGSHKNYFVGIDLIQDVLYGYTVNGILYQIDTETGRFLNRELIK